MKFHKFRVSQIYDEKISERKEIAGAKKELGIAAWSRLIKQFGGSQTNESGEPVTSPIMFGFAGAPTHGHFCIFILNFI